MKTCQKDNYVPKGESAMIKTGYSKLVRFKRREIRDIIFIILS